MIEPIHTHIIDHRPTHPTNQIRFTLAGGAHFPDLPHIHAFGLCPSARSTSSPLITCRLFQTAPRRSTSLAGGHVGCSGSLRIHPSIRMPSSFPRRWIKDGSAQTRTKEERAHANWCTLSASDSISFSQYTFGSYAALKRKIHLPPSHLRLHHLYNSLDSRRSDCLPLFVRFRWIFWGISAFIFVISLDAVLVVMDLFLFLFFFFLISVCAGDLWAMFDAWLWQERSKSRLALAFRCCFRLSCFGIWLWRDDCVLRSVIVWYDSHISVNKELSFYYRIVDLVLPASLIGSLWYADLFWSDGSNSF